MKVLVLALLLLASCSGRKQIEARVPRYEGQPMTMFGDPEHRTILILAPEGTDSEFIGLEGLCEREDCKESYKGQFYYIILR